MSILVTGGAGLVGSRLLRRFAKSRNDCRALIRAGKQVPAGVAIVEGDLFDTASLKTAVEEVSTIVHLAAVFRTQNEDEIWRVNLDGSRNLIDAAKQYAPKVRFIMASTALVYNENAPRPGKEDDEVSPQRAYPASKVAAEKERRPKEPVLEFRDDACRAFSNRRMSLKR